MTLRLYFRFRRKMSADDLTAGGLFCCLVLAVLSSWFAPGASFVFVWPLAFVLLSLATAILARQRTPIVVLRLLCAIPAVALLVPLIGYVVVTLSGDPG